MMETVVSLWLRRDQLCIFFAYFDWFVRYLFLATSFFITYHALQAVCYGILAAGVLCVELLKQAKTPHESTLRFSRSTLIKELTMFTGFLDWIRLTDGNYLLCGKLSKVVRRIVDYVLEPPITTPTPPPPHLHQQQHCRPTRDLGIIDRTAIGSGLGLEIVQQQSDPLWDVSEDTDECLDWLNSLDWMQGPWLDSNR